MKASTELQKSAEMIRNAPSIEPARVGFAVLSEALAAAVNRFGNGVKQKISRIRCPMVFSSRGAEWLQNHDQIENPYFGKAMPRCGELVEILQKGPIETTIQDARRRDSSS